MSLWKRAAWYVRYLSRARSPVRIRSRLVSDLLQLTLPHSFSPAGQRVRRIQRGLRTRTDVVTYQDLGAGTIDSGPGLVTRRVADLARRSSRTYREGEFLHRLCRELQPEVALELGTHLGLSALYQASAMRGGRFVTVEGAKAIAEVARATWAEFRAEGTPGVGGAAGSGGAEGARRSGGAGLAEVAPELVVGSFDEVLPRLLGDGLRPDYVLLDGNHAYEPTLRYTRQLIDALGSDGEMKLLVLDDIYWSKGMVRAWEEVVTWPEVAVSVDLYRFGLLFLGDLGEKEHAVVR